MTTARELMTPDPVCVDSSNNVRQAAGKMATSGVGALPIRGEDGKLKGMITDRDIVVKVLAEGKDPMAVHVGELAQREVVTVNADDDAETVLRTMASHEVRRLPVMEGHTLVGIIAQADVARALPKNTVGALLADISAE